VPSFPAAAAIFDRSTQTNHALKQIFRPRCANRKVQVGDVFAD
jgi:hypothetical protein